MGLVHGISSGCSTQTLSLGLGSFEMAKLKSAFLFGVTIYFEMKMGQNSPGLVWFGWYDLNLYDGEGNFSVGKYHCHNTNSTPTSTYLSWVRHENGLSPQDKLRLLTIWGNFLSHNIFFAAAWQNRDLQSSKEGPIQSLFKQFLTYIQNIGFVAPQFEGFKF